MVSLLLCLCALCAWAPPSARCIRGPHHPRGATAVQHAHARPRPDHKITSDEQLLHDIEHISEDLAEWGSDSEGATTAMRNRVDKMTPEELEFHYFMLHDLDNNTKLDGLEILCAIQHTSHEQQEPSDDHSDFPYYVELIDQVLNEDDADNDGYLSYPEFVLGRKQNKNNAAQFMQKPT